MSEVAEVLREAQVIIEKGWTKGKMHDTGRTKFCALGALDLAASGQVETFIKAGVMLGEVIQEQYPDRTLIPHLGHLGTAEACSCGAPHINDTIAPFNDHVATTRDEVLTMFDKAIVKAEEAVE